MLAVPTKSAKIKDCHPKCLGKYRSRPRCNVKRLFAPNSHLAKLKTREVANITHLQNVDARRRCSSSAGSEDGATEMSSTNSFPPSSLPAEEGSSTERGR